MGDCWKPHGDKIVMENFAAAVANSVKNRYYIEQRTCKEKE